MKTFLIALFLLVKAPLERLLTSMKFWTAVIGTTSTYLAQKGIILDPAMAQYVAGFFALLLAGQAATDHGKAAAEIHAKSMADAPPPAELVEPKAPEAGSARMGVLVSLMLIGVVLFSACGANSRERAVRATFAATTTTQAAFEAWDREHTHEIAQTAPDEATGTAELAAYAAKREHVLDAFAFVYKAIAAAAALEDQPSIALALKELKALHDDLSTLSGGKLP